MLKSTRILKRICQEFNETHSLLANTAMNKAFLICFQEATELGVVMEIFGRNIRKAAAVSATVTSQTKKHPSYYESSVRPLGSFLLF